MLSLPGPLLPVADNVKKTSEKSTEKKAQRGTVLKCLSLRGLYTTRYLNLTWTFTKKFFLSLFLVKCYTKKWEKNEKNTFVVFQKEVSM